MSPGHSGARSSLEQLVGTPMPVGELLPLAIRLCSALAELHGRGELHQELRPATILRDRATGDVTLVRSGSATALVEGALPYLSPEQTGQMNRPIDSRSDLYSLGIVLYQLLAGRLPFEADDAVGWVHCHIARQPRPLDQVRPSLPRPLSDVVGRLLAKLPDHRYQGAAGLRHDLERCRAEWADRGAIAAFALGERDVSEEFRIAQGLYGRDAELAVVREAFERVAETSTSELILVSGYAGIGKSAVVRELLRPIAQRRGRFIAGKFEQYQRDVPYFTISQALRSLALDLLAEGEPGIGRWRQRLAQALGAHGQLIVDLVPELGLILGPQPAVPEAALTEGEQRLRLVFGRLFAACADEHPLTLFIDDLQWADTASLQLVAHLTTDGEARQLLIIGAYRDNEVDATHPMVLALEPVRRGGAPIHDVVLGPLSEDDLGRLVADTVRVTAAEAAPLTGLVRDKTGGNPFFAIQFLTALYHKRAIWFDREAYRWRWDVARIHAEGYTDNIAELMRGRLHALPAETRAALQLAACIGGTADAATLAIASGRELGPALRPAIEQQLLLESVQAGRRSYRFPHDRVHEAAYTLVPEPERARVHLEIGRRLLASAPADELAGRVFEIVNQLDRGAALIEERPERERLAELHLTAGARAQASTAYASALRYFTAGAALLADDAWDRRPALAFALELHRAECEFLTGALEAAEPRLAALVPRATSIVDLAAVASARISILSMRGRNAPAIEVMLEFLRRAGIEWLASPTDDQVRCEHDRIWEQLGSRTIEELVDLPPMTDPDLCAIMDVLALTQAAALSYDVKLHSLMICRLVNLSLEHGNSDTSCIGYSALGMILRPRFDDHVAGFRFGQVALDLVERRGLLRWKARVYLDFGILNRPWVKHPRASIELTRRSFDLAKETGDLMYATFACHNLSSLLLTVGEPLAAVQSQTEAGLAFMQKTGFDVMVNIETMQLQAIRSLRGLTRRLGSLDDEEFDEARFEQLIEGNPHLALTICWYWIRKLQVRFIAGDHAGAAAAAARARPLRWSTPSFLEAADYVFYAALACAAYHDAAPHDERPRLREELAANHRQLAVWAEYGPENFGNRAALVGAELARVGGEPDQAIQGYEQAIRSALEHGFIQNEAIAYETAARFYRGRGQTLVADAFVREAHARYLRWGADGKARQLRADHPELEPGSGGPATPALRPDQLAQLSVIKASQTISGVMDTDLLASTLLRFVLEEGGARRAVLILTRGGELEIAAEARVDEVAAPLAAVLVPRSLLSYVQRTQELLLYDATADAGRFAADPYFAGARPCSVLCLPVRLRAESVALLYLENDLVPGAFTSERLLALELLTAQAAISLENARLLERERAGRIEAEAAKHRELLLGEATALMSQTLDDAGVSGVLARLCDHAFVDWAVVDLEDNGAMARVAAVHRDPDKQALLRDSVRHPARPGETTLGWQLPRVADAHDPPVLDEDQISAGCADAHDAELFHQLGTRSAIVVPLPVRDDVNGALSLASATAHRFGRADAELAAELGRRMALAIDNARLLRETRHALHLREEFLRIASHELRTPLASLQLSSQALLRAAERKRAVPPEFLDGSLRRMLGNSMRLEQLTSELLDVTRIEHGRLELNRVEIALDALVRDAVGHLEPDLAAAGSAVSIECAAPVHGWWDPSRLAQMITNLVSNAVKFGAGKPIEIRIEQLDDTARLSVTDRGIGIDPARRPYVFDRFERAVPSSSYGGLGLGLYIARSIVVSHGGAITVDSELGAGATFTVTLPRSPPQRPAAG